MYVFAKFLFSKLLTNKKSFRRSKVDGSIVINLTIESLVPTDGYTILRLENITYFYRFH